MGFITEHRTKPLVLWAEVRVRGNSNRTRKQGRPWALAFPWFPHVYLSLGSSNLSADSCAHSAILIYLFILCIQAFQPCLSFIACIIYIIYLYWLFHRHRPLCPREVQHQQHKHENKVLFFPSCLAADSVSDINSQSWSLCSSVTFLFCLPAGRRPLRKPWAVARGGGWEAERRRKLNPRGQLTSD